MQDLQAIRFFYDGKKKVSHDYEDKNVTTFSYREMFAKGVECVGLPCRQNNFVVIDIDVPSDSHKHDGRAWWSKFVEENDITPTYTVATPTGGMHFYYKLPDHVNPDTFSPPSALALGVDVKWNGWVGAPPTAGYDILHGNIASMAEAPTELLDELHRAKQGALTNYEVTYEEGQSLALATPYTDKQIEDLRNRLQWVQKNAELTRSEWRDGIFSLKAGIDDPEILDELVQMWTFNRNYSVGDEVEARDIAGKAEKYGSIGPGTILGIIQEHMKQGSAVTTSIQLDRAEILDNSGIDYAFKDNGALTCTPSETNAMTLISTMYPEEELYYDSRTDQYIFQGNPSSDNEVANLIAPKMQSRHGLFFDKLKLGTIRAGLDMLMAHRKIDPHARWIEGLEWDGVDRIGTFFPKYVGSEDSEYTRLVSKNFWIALVARNIDKGTKFDNIVVIEGREGVRKSSLIEAIGGEYTFAPSTRRSFDDTDDLRKMHQAVIVELPELMGLAGENSNKVKAFLSKSQDDIRGLYQRVSTKKKRGFVFVGTTNDSTYLSKDMGERRFWPIKIIREGNIDINGVQMDREQLYAEAVYRYNNREKFHEMPPELLAPHVSEKVTIDPIYGLIEKIVKDKEEVELDQIFIELSGSGVMAKGLTHASAKKITDCLSQIGYVKRTHNIWKENKVELSTFL